MPKRGVRRKGRRAELWSIEGAQSVFRAPFFEDGRWRARRRDLRTGEVRRLTLLAENLSEAKRELVEKAAQERGAAEEAVKNPEAVKPEDATLGDALDRWLGTIEVRKTTEQDYRLSVALYKRELGAGRLVAEIGLGDIEAFLFSKLADAAGRTRLKHRAFLRRAWTWFIRHGFCRVNLPDMIESPKAWREEARVTKEEIGNPLSWEEARAFLRVCREPVILTYRRTKRRVGREEEVKAQVESPERLALFVHLSLLIGLRVSNVLGGPTKPGVRWMDLDLERETVRIPREFTKNNNPFEVPLHPEVVEVLKDRLRALGKVDPKDQVVPAGEIKRSFASALRRAGLGHRRIHDLRVTFGTWLGAIAPEFVVRRLLGHAKGDVTARYAQRAGIEELRGWLAKLPGLLGERKSLDATAEAR